MRGSSQSLIDTSMRRKGLVIFGLLAIAITAWYFYQTHNRNLRGWWRYTSDGKTYLIISNSEGKSPEINCTLDGHPSPLEFGEKVEITPGSHELGCPMNVGFIVPAGVEYHFDYWGP
jgi:hypothetical protein